MDSQDITDQFEDLNVEDRVFRVGEHMIKVKVFHDPAASAPGREVFRASGSQVGPDGKALVHSSGMPMVHQFGRHLVVHGHSAVDIESEVATLRAAAVSDTIHAITHAEAIRSIPGVGVMRAGSPPLALPPPAQRD